MSLGNQSSSLTDDSRGVSTVIGFIFIFAFIIIFLSVYQAQFVPQQNREVEFSHFQEVRNDMVEIRSGVLTAGETDVSQYPTIRLGTSYPTRAFAINPAPPTGELRTSDAYNITIEPSDSGSSNVSTRFLVYRNNYNQMDIGPIWYENSVLYLDERGTGGRVVVYQNQNIVVNNSSTRVTALQNEISKTSAGRVTVELYPTESTNINSTAWNGSVTLRIPTRLNGTEYWDEELGGVDGYNLQEDAVAEGVHYLEINVSASSLKFNTVGIDASPDDTNRVSQGVGIAPPPGTSTSPPGTSTPPPLNEPRFDTLSVEVSQTETQGNSPGNGGGNVRIAEVEASGSLTQADTNGQIQMELFIDSTGNNQFNQNSIQMQSPFTIRTSPNEDDKKELYVEIRLLDGNDSPYQTCFSDSTVDPDTTLSLSDFTCQTP